MSNAETMDAKDVLIRTDRETVAHKFQENVPDGETPYWSVNGCPRQTEPGRTILFSDGSRVIGRSRIVAIEEGRIWFAPLKEVDQLQPADPPSQGFTYVSLDACALCGERRKTAERDGSPICSDCSRHRIAIEAWCTDCDWRYPEDDPRVDTEFQRASLRQLVQNQANTHEREMDMFEDETHETEWREVTPPPGSDHRGILPLPDDLEDLDVVIGTYRDVVRTVVLDVHPTRLVGSLVASSDYTNHVRYTATVDVQLALPSQRVTVSVVPHDGRLPEERTFDEFFSRRADDRPPADKSGVTVPPNVPDDAADEAVKYVVRRVREVAYGE